MTFREKLKKEYPDCATGEKIGMYCPSSFQYEESGNCRFSRNCTECWNREIPEPKETTDSVNHPSHYTQGGVECIDALESATAGLTGIEAVCTANAIKYLWRWKRKNGVEDLEKAAWYIQHLITHEQKGGANAES